MKTFLGYGVLYDIRHLMSFVILEASLLYYSQQNPEAGQPEKEASGPPDILSKAAMHNAYYICHNVQVRQLYVLMSSLLTAIV